MLIGSSAFYRATCGGSQVSTNRGDHLADAMPSTGQPRVPTRSARYHWPPGDRGGSPALRRPTTTGRRGRDRLGGLCGHRLDLTLGGRCPGPPCSPAWSRRCARPMPTDAHLLSAAPMRGPDAGELRATRVPDGGYRIEPTSGDGLAAQDSEPPASHPATAHARPSPGSGSRQVSQGGPTAPRSRVTRSHSVSSGLPPHASSVFV
jgi:hypothetical protein